MAVLAGVAALTAGSGFAASSDPATALGFHPVSPTVRVLDTRNGTGAPAAALGAGATLDLAFSGLPDDASAVTLNVTVVGGTTASHLKAYPKGAAQPDTSVLAWSSTITMSTTVVVPLGTTQSVTFFNKNGSVHVVADLVGYFAPGGVVNTGPAGPQGPQGQAGAAGQPGAPGQNGVDGDPGINGRDAVMSGVVSMFAVNTDPQRIARNGRVLFTERASVNDGFNFVLAGPSAGDGLAAGEFLVTADGVYKVTFSVSPAEASQLDLYVNRVAMQPSMSFGAPLGQPNTATAIVELTAGDVLTLVNATSAGQLNDDVANNIGDLTLPANLGGSATAINAWITIELVSWVTAPPPPV